MEYIKDKDIVVNVISKSGNTLEPSLAFDLTHDLMKEKYREEEILERIIITTDKEIGKDAINFFNYLSGYSSKPEYKSLLVAPVARHGGRFFPRVLVLFPEG